MSLSLLIINVNLNADTLDGCEAIRRAFEELGSGCTPKIVHWTAIGPSDLASSKIDALIVGPNEAPFGAYPPAFQVFLECLRLSSGPTLGICGGHQVLGLAYGASVGPVFDVPPPQDSYEGLAKVKGIVRVEILDGADPILEGVDSSLLLDASHVEELRDLPSCFRLLASNERSKIQLMVHESRPVYGVQCHPERAWAETDGKTLLLNFLKVARASSGPSGDLT